MKLSVYSIQETLFEGEAEKVLARTSMGAISVLDRHIPLITALVGPSVIIRAKGKKDKVVPLVSGFLEVRPQSEVVILANPE